MGRAEALAEIADLLDRDHAALVSLVDRLKHLADDPKRQISDLFEGLSAQKRALMARLADLRDETVGEVSLLRAEIVLGRYDESA
jgi:ferritin-like protein